MRDTKPKLGLLNFFFLKKPAFYIEEMTEGLQFGSQAMVFAILSSDNQLFYVEEVVYNLKRHLSKGVEENLE